MKTTNYNVRKSNCIGENMEEQAAKSIAKNGCNKLFDIVWDFLKFLYSGERLKIILSCLLVIWVVAIINTVVGGRLNEYGITPRDFPFGFLGILFAPFIHSNLFHAAANSISFVVFAAIVMLRGLDVWITVSVSSDFCMDNLYFIRKSSSGQLLVTTR